MNQRPLTLLAAHNYMQDSFHQAPAHRACIRQRRGEEYVKPWSVQSGSVYFLFGSECLIGSLSGASTAYILEERKHGFEPKFGLLLLRFFGTIYTDVYT